MKKLPERLEHKIKYRKPYDVVVIEDEKGGFVAECGEVTAPSSEREAAEICRRYNTLPKLEARNRELVEAIIELDKQCVFMHRYGGTAYNGPEADAAIQRIKELLAPAAIEASK
jgi:hypothetical protein